MDYLKAKKLNMGEIFKDDKRIPVTYVQILGDEMPEFFSGESIKVSGVSKGKGFQGTVKRYGFHGGPKTHGQKNRLRAPGSIGSTAPQRVLPGRRMAGRMGGDNVSIKNLKVVSFNDSTMTLALRGAIPGNNRGLLKIFKK